MDQPFDEDCPPAPVPDGALVRELPIVNRKGLHARASAKFVKLASTFDAEVKVSKDGSTVDARSIMGLMMLAAGIGSSIEVTCSGPQRDEAMAAISALVEGKFGED
jgi:phosphocarrier protein HPr